MSDVNKARCSHCGKSFKARVDGAPYHHKGPKGQYHCPGAGVAPEPAVPPARVTDWSKPVPVSDVEIAFPASAMELMPSWDECEAGLDRLPREEKEKWLDFQGSWFSKGLSADAQFSLKDGIDGNAAFRQLMVLQGSFAPKHEHKMAGVAYLASLWFEDGVW